MSSLVEIESEDAFNHHVASLTPSTLLVISFHTPWAAPCAQMKTVLNVLASTYPVTNPPTVSFVSINAEELPEVSENYDVTAVPFLVLVRGGQTLETVSGSDASKVRATVERYAGQGNASHKGIPPPLEATPRKEDTSTTNGVKNLSGYAPQSNDPATAPETSSADAQSLKEELFARLGNLVKAAPVMLFMKGTPSSPQCGFSRQLVAILREKGVKYGFFNILADDEVRQGLKEFADWPTFPQLWVGGELVGGLDIVKEEIAADPDFLSDYSVSKSAGGPAGPDAQARPAATAV
ncbi:putative monothiol glutaredoxin-4 [Phaeomoniella chlamydospora]|uniref:Putative monothiol glutaredoxin-4 n=1 Tax=Phaeomoniella chlamydospora TaxID=158046 RepID=A0A0G2GT50_PHACM|nr:putative monothiol glutaredoxin-4 [Phaeomoniella chlamydospora]